MCYPFVIFVAREKSDLSSRSFPDNCDVLFLQLPDVEAQLVDSLIQDGGVAAARMQCGGAVEHNDNVAGNRIKI